MQSNNNEDNPQHWQVLAEREIFKLDPWMQIFVQDIRLPDGRKVDNYGRIDLSGYICVFAQVPDGRVIVEKQYQHGVGRVSLVLPAGTIEQGEEPLVAAQRELLEETGYQSDQWKSLGSFFCHGNYGCGSAHFFFAQDCRLVVEPDSGDLEDMEIMLLSEQELLKALGQGDIALVGTAALIGLVQLARSGFLPGIDSEFQPVVAS